jgi:hypothetical protein
MTFDAVVTKHALPFYFPGRSGTRAHTGRSVYFCEVGFVPTDKLIQEESEPEAKELLSVLEYQIELEMYQ